MDKSIAEYSAALEKAYRDREDASRRKISTVDWLGIEDRIASCRLALQRALDEAVVTRR